MSEQLKVTIGADRSWPLQCWLDGAVTPAAFGASDAISAYVYRGQDQSQLFSLTAAPYTDNSGTGYPGGQIKLTIAGANSATLEANGEYAVLAWWTPQGSSERRCVWRGRLLAEPAAGTAAQVVTTYCTYADMLRYAPWVELIQDSDTDQEGFYSQRLEARQTIDWAILNCYRGAYVGLFEGHSTMAFEFGYAGWRRSLGPSPSLITYLENNDLILRPQIVEIAARWSIWLVGMAQVGTNNLYAGYGAFHRDMAERAMIATTAEIDINGDGIGELFINLSSTNTLFT